VLRERVRRLVCDFPFTDNYFAWQALGRGYGPAGTALPPYLEARATRPCGPGRSGGCAPPDDD
jgi:S-adenosylmethionine:diacylglycerol 3-amino-3-carboxypropyl transferase